MKLKNKRKLNAAIWIAITIIVMIVVGCKWSENAPYTLFSFFASLVFHGGFFFLIAVLIDEYLTDKDK